jgi:hypothetical protein
VSSRRMRPGIVLAALVLASAPVAQVADPQPPPTARTGLLESIPTPWSDALRQALGDLGWIEGRNVTIEQGPGRRWA